jgi:hypothetical protein
MASGRSLVTKAPAEHAVPKEPASDELAHTEGATRADGGRAEVQALGAPGKPVDRRALLHWPHRCGPHRRARCRISPGLTIIPTLIGGVLLGPIGR